MNFRLSYLGFLFAVLLLFVLAAPAEAHADLVQSVPEANAALDRSPAQIELFLSEPVEASFSTIQVIDSNGQRVDNDDAALDPADPTRLTVSLRTLSDGVYIVSWQVLSSVDSHITAGAFPFAVGNVEAAALAAAAEASQRVKISPGEVVVRWLTFFSGLALAGGALFILLVWQPAVGATGAGPSVRPPWGRLGLAALLILLAANLFWLLLQAGQASGGEIAAPWNPALTQVLFNTRFGALWLGRLFLALLLIWLLVGEAGQRRRWLALGAALLLLLTISLGSHAAAQPNPFLPILSDWIHLSAAATWVGGLAYFMTALYATRALPAEARTQLTATLIPRFSALALVSVGTLVITGSYASILHLSLPDDLIGSPYGRTLLVKLALVLPMILLGAVNLLVTSPRMKRAAESGGSPRLVTRFRRLVSSEITLGAAVLLSVGLLTVIPPAQTPAVAPMLNGLEEADDLEIALEVSPGRPGLNTFLVTVTSDGQPVNGVREVTLQFTPTTAELPPSSAQLTGQGNGEYLIEGGFLALPDAWQMQVAVRRENAFDTFANFNFSVGTTAAVQTFSWYRVTAVLILLAAAVYPFALSHLLPVGRQKLVFGRLPAVMLALLGVIILIWPPIDEGGSMPNPIPPNADSIATGKALYEENCLPCHGATGAGDGPVGLALNPPPADLTIHTAPGVHPDSRLFNWISNGFQDSPMPAFEDKLTEDERWHLVNYIRTLALP